MATEDGVKITLWVPDQQALKTITASAKVSLDCGSPETRWERELVITLYATAAEAAKVTAPPFSSEVDDNFAAYLAERPQEVSRGDRFQGGKVKPEGLGTKQ